MLELQGAVVSRVEPEDVVDVMSAHLDALARGMGWFERALWWLLYRSPFGVRVIRVHGKPYLLRGQMTPTRWFIPRVYLLYFLESDQDRELHNHPFSGVSLILTRGYCEWRKTQPDSPMLVGRDVKPGSLNLIRSRTFHRVELVNGRCWTLFVTGKRVGPSDGTDWGFMDPRTGAYTPWGVHKSVVEPAQLEAP